MTRFDTVDFYADRKVNLDRMAAIERHLVGSVADVGCGSGAYVSALAARTPSLGLDQTRFPTWEGAPGRFVQADAAVLPLRANSVDTLLVFETLEHLAEPEAALAEYARVTRRRLLLTVPNCTVSPGMRASNLIYHHWIDPTHLNFWSLDEVASLVDRNGFKVIEQKLINRIDPLPLLREMLPLPKPARRLFERIVRRRSLEYRMTSLVVADRVS
jgi:ubiquinone/menaquinone biosynthesis C-methylase UbiE